MGPGGPDGVVLPQSRRPARMAILHGCENFQGTLRTGPRARFAGILLVGSGKRRPGNLGPAARAQIGSEFSRIRLRWRRVRRQPGALTVGSASATLFRSMMHNFSAEE